MVIGPTGCGKTSLLMALLSEMHYIPDAVDSWYNLPRDRGVAYTAQESWVLNATIKVPVIQFFVHLILLTLGRITFFSALLWTKNVTRRFYTSALWNRI